MKLFQTYLNTKINNNNFESHRADENSVFNVIHSTNSNCVGIVGLNISFMQWCYRHILPYITSIINTSFETGQYPLRWNCNHDIMLNNNNNNNDKLTLICELNYTK